MDMNASVASAAARVLAGETEAFAVIETFILELTVYPCARVPLDCAHVALTSQSLLMFGGCVLFAAGLFQAGNGWTKISATSS